MKNKIVWIGIFIVVIVAVIIGAYVMTNKNTKDDKKDTTDALKFKNEYESLNGKDTSTGDHKYRSIEIADDNPFVYATADSIADMMDNKDTFLVYFGFDSCPWCRSVVPTLVKVAKDLNVNNIYYVSVKDIRDTKEIDDEGNIETTKEGSEGYYKLIDKMSNVLADYELTDKDDNTVSADEKRIFAPNVVLVVKGEATKLTEGISEDQNDGYMELTDDMINDTYKQFEEILNEYKENDTLCEDRQGC